MTEMVSSRARGNIELSEVRSALRRAPKVASPLGVSAREGVVTLSGSVSSAAERAAAEAAAGHVPGVTALSDELAVVHHSIPRTPRHRCQVTPGTNPVPPERHVTTTAGTPNAGNRTDYQ
jgi:BON domain